MEFKGTKGEWYVKHGHVYCDGGVIALGGSIRSVDETRREGEPWLSMRERVKPEREAIKKEKAENVKLIAAAPELLEALRDVRKWYEENHDKYLKDENGYLTPVCFSKALSAINKAIG